MYMKTPAVIAALGALAHERRLAIYRVLVERGPEGLSAGDIGDRVGLLPSSLTFHLQNLKRAGLIEQRRVSRQIFYSVDFALMNGLVGYLTENCCRDGAAGCCAPAQGVKPVRRTARVA